MVPRTEGRTGVAPPRLAGRRGLAAAASAASARGRLSAATAAAPRAPATTRSGRAGAAASTLAARLRTLLVVAPTTSPCSASADRPRVVFGSAATPASTAVDKTTFRVTTHAATATLRANNTHAPRTYTIRSSSSYSFFQPHASAFTKYYYMSRNREEIRLTARSPSLSQVSGN